MNLQLKAPEQKLENMSKPDKKKFFSLDLADRMIKVEQNVSKSFNCPVTLEQTEYYKSMSPIQQDELKKFINHKKKNKILSFAGLFAPLLLISLFNINFTGNAISETVGTQTFGLMQIILFGLFGILLAGIFIIFLYGLAIEHKLYKHVRLIESILGRKFNNQDKLSKIKKAF